jgi:hypothetical protein
MTQPPVHLVSLLPLQASHADFYQVRDIPATLKQLTFQFAAASGNQLKEYIGNKLLQMENELSSEPDKPAETVIRGALLGQHATLTNSLITGSFLSCLLSLCVRLPVRRSFAVPLCSDAQRTNSLRAS